MDMEEEQEYEEQMMEDEEIMQEDAWAVISAYFEEKGLVRQQLDSFDEFIQNTIQEIVDESADIEIRPQSHNPRHKSDVAEAFSFTFLFFLFFLFCSIMHCFLGDKHPGTTSF